jgi:hypothetical protein
MCASRYTLQGASRKVGNMRLRPDSSPAGAGVAEPPAPTTASKAPSATVVPEKHLHPALLAALRRRIAQAAGHPGIPYH